MPRTLLSALLQLNEEVSEVHEISIDKIRINPNQPREYFKEESIEELAASIQNVGLIQPIVVRKFHGGEYELVAGERRLRACKKLGMQKIGAIVRRLSDAEAMALALIENLQRENLTPIEEAKAYRSIIERFGLSQQQLAVKVGKSQPLISNLLKLLNLPEEVQQMVAIGKLNQGQGRVLLGLNNSHAIRRLARKAVENEWTAKYLERIVNELLERESMSDNPADKSARPRSAFVEQLNLFRDSVLGSLKEFSSKVGFNITAEERDSEEYYEIVLKIRKGDRGKTWSNPILDDLEPQQVQEQQEPESAAPDQAADQQES